MNSKNFNDAEEMVMDSAGNLYHPDKEDETAADQFAENENGEDEDDEDEDEDGEFDSATVGKSVTHETDMGQTLHYKGVKVIRNGHAVTVNHRVGGAKVRLSPLQKRALAKARMKAHSGAANRARTRSFKKGAALHLHHQ